MWVLTYFSLKSTTRTNHWQQFCLHPFHTNRSRTPLNIVLVSRQFDEVQCSSGRPPTLHQRHGLPQLEMEISELHHVIPHTQHSRPIMILVILRSRRRLKFRRWSGKDKPFMLQVRRVHCIYYVKHTLFDLSWKTANSNCWSITWEISLTTKFLKWVSFDVIPSQLC